MSLNYRPEIDGLRAIAVTAVVLYHADFVIRGINPFKGGFIGVDVFFVISGYLITSIIAREMQEGNFSFATFYERRARRILPALFTVTAASIPFAWMYMLPKALKEYAGSVLSILVFGSNIWFWLEDSYTAEPSALKPLLHTWSLSVEEQFYILFPIILLLLWKFLREHITTIFVLAFFFSLQLAHFGSANFADANFYLLPTRTWELLAGAILAKVELDKGRISHPFLDLTMPSIGLFLICNAIVFLDDQMRHPSLITLLPVVGTMLLIWFCKKRELVSDLLGSTPFVAVGLISYSFYLWHFPIFAFARIKDDTLSGYDKIEHTALALLLSVATYLLIEKPFRRKDKAQKGPFLIAILLPLSCIASFSVALIGKHSNTRFDKVKFNIESEKTKRFQYSNSICSEIGWTNCGLRREDKINLLVVGDSMSPDAVNILWRQFPNIHFVINSLGGCPPHPDIAELVPHNHPQLNQCVSLNKQRFSESSLKDFDGVIIFNLYSWYRPKHLREYLEFLRSSGVTRVIIFGNYLRTKSGMDNIILSSNSKAEVFRKLAIDGELIEGFEYDDELEKLAAEYDFYFMSIKKFACNTQECLVFHGNYPFSWDQQHFSVEFANYLSEKMKQTFLNSWIGSLIMEKDGDIKHLEYMKVHDAVK